MRPIRIANCSGFYGDRIDAARDLLDGPDAIDVLTGDYLAELTMLILWKAQQKDASAGYATTFLRQMEGVLATCAERGIKVVTNAGGLNPRSLAARLRKLADRIGVDMQIAVVEGDDIIDQLPALQAAGHELTHLDTGEPFGSAPAKAATANAYLGGWGISAALDVGADIVVCGRVTDASLVVGPAAWWHRWARDDWNALAGAVVAGHVIECGTQATGGNYPFLDELVPGYPGFPITEVQGDGSSVITKQPGTGGAVTIGTVTAQLLYEIDGAAYANPDVVARFDTIRLSNAGPDRVAINDVQGTSAPDHLKVAINYIGGYRNAMTMILTGLDVDAKAAHAETLLFEVLGGREQFDAVDVQLLRSDHPDAATNPQAMAQLRVTVKSTDRALVGRRFSSAVFELALASYAGFFTSTPPSAESEFGVYWPTLVPADVVDHAVILPNGSRIVVPHTVPAADAAVPAVSDPFAPSVHAGETLRRPLGAACGGRSGDKGGNANVGLWASDERTYSWLVPFLTIERLRELLPEARGLDIRRAELPNLYALNFVIVGILGEGVASSVRIDAQAKGLAEYLRSRIVDMPKELLP